MAALKRKRQARREGAALRVSDPQKRAEIAAFLEKERRTRGGQSIPTLIEANRVAVEDGADPDHPNRTVRRARRVWTPDVMLKGGSLDQTQHNAAVRYVSSYEVGVEGAKSRAEVFVQASGAPAGIADLQLMAATDFRQAATAAGEYNAPILWWAVLNNGTLGDYAQCRGWHLQKAVGYLTAALDRLAEHYRSTGRP